ncbi:MAG: hypothetical protein INQ03_22260 [Candidatus Heimdallarchaeota archaeon]|nr:hypothetical protein [Candidatus Heimdallarchaeota archaeon]
MNKIAKILLSIFLYFILLSFVAVSDYPDKDNFALGFIMYSFGILFILIFAPVILKLNKFKTSLSKENFTASESSYLSAVSVLLLLLTLVSIIVMAIINGFHHPHDYFYLILLLSVPIGFSAFRRGEQRRLYQGYIEGYEGSVSLEKAFSHSFIIPELQDPQIVTQIIDSYSPQIDLEPYFHHHFLRKLARTLLIIVTFVFITDDPAYLLGASVVVFILYALSFLHIRSIGMKIMKSTNSNSLFSNNTKKYQQLISNAMNLRIYARLSISALAVFLASLVSVHWFLFFPLLVLILYYAQRNAVQQTSFRHHILIKGGLAAVGVTPYIVDQFSVQKVFGHDQLFISIPLLNQLSTRKYPDQLLYLLDSFTMAIGNSTLLSLVRMIVLPIIAASFTILLNISGISMIIAVTIFFSTLLQYLYGMWISNLITQRMRRVIKVRFLRMNQEIKQEWNEFLLTLFPFRKISTLRSIYHTMNAETTTKKLHNAMISDS